MAVMLRRAGFVLLALLAVLLPLRKPPGGERPFNDDRVARLEFLSYRADKARTVWSALIERDSALQLLSRLERPSPTPVVELQGFEPGMRAAEAEGRIAKLWQSVDASQPSVRVAALIYNAERNAAVMGRSTWRNYWGNLITERNGVTWCVAIMPGALWRGAPSVGKELLDHAMAPCVLLAVFGPPGAGMRHWLEGTRYAAARSNGWLEGAGETGRIEGDREGPWVWLREVGERSPGAERTYSLVKTLGADQFVNLLAPPYHYGARGVRCAAGDAVSCEASVLRAVIGDSTIPADLTLGGFLLFAPRVGIETLRAPAYFYLSELIRAHGRDGFRSLWRSELPIDRAFLQAFGEPLGKWTATWAHRQWAASWQTYYYGKKNLILGVDLHPSWLLLLTLWTALVLALAGWTATRRQLT